MATLSNSSVSAWLENDGYYFLDPQIYPCQLVSSPPDAPRLSIVQTPCSQVCNDSLSLFWPPDSDHPSSNLATCGIWTSTMSNTRALNDDESFRIGNWTRFTALFADIGLDEDDMQYLPSYIGTISDCLVSIYINVKLPSSSYDSAIPAAPLECHQGFMFPRSIGDIGHSGSVLREFLEAMRTAHTESRSCWHWSEFFMNRQWLLLTHLAVFRCFHPSYYNRS